MTFLSQDAIDTGISVTWQQWILRRDVDATAPQIHFQEVFVALEGSSLVAASIFQLSIQRHFLVFYMENMTCPLKLTVDKQMLNAGKFTFLQDM